MPIYNILKSDLSDLDFACHLFTEAIAYQKRNNYPEYRWDDRSLQESDIKNGRHYKVVKDGEIAAIFTIWYSDEKIWLEKDIGESLYLHRIIVNPTFKGNNLLKHILNWTIEHANLKKKTNIRLDTWANNPTLISYYITNGFKFIEHFQIPSSNDIPLNCRGNQVALMEYKLNTNSK